MGNNKKSDNDFAISILAWIFIAIITSIIFLFKFIFTCYKSSFKYVYNSKKKLSKRDIILEKEMNNYNLEEHEKKEVRNGNYDVTSFEMDGNLEEDDYYNEDI